MFILIKVGLRANVVSKKPMVPFEVSKMRVVVIDPAIRPNDYNRFT